MSEQETYSEIRDTLDALGAPAKATSMQPRDLTISERIRGLRFGITDAAANTLAAARDGFNSAMASVVAERDEVIRQRDEALGRVAAVTEALRAAEHDRDYNDAAYKGAFERAGRHQTERDDALAEIEALGRALSAAGLPTAETLAGRVAGLQLMRAEALSEARALATERDNCRDVLRREREERAAEKATVGKALADVRAERNMLQTEAGRISAANVRLMAQLDVVERIIVAGLRP